MVNCNNLRYLLSAWFSQIRSLKKSNSEEAQDRFTMNNTKHDTRVFNCHDGLDNKVLKREIQRLQEKLEEVGWHTLCELVWYTLSILTVNMVLSLMPTEAGASYPEASIYSFLPSFTHSLARSLVRSFARSPARPPARPLDCPPSLPPVCSAVRPSTNR